ncbi:ArsC family reductase [uncultured Methylibium sp.]|uniref:ArsC family reductase n=1 Tax=uncultured Methylibium sp. TaxID=381093 RepID=UPI0025E54233|nr:ArsC family reductase [uncultured Methylibium sp.]
MTVLYGIPNCDTVKKARAWLDAADVAYRFHDFKKAGVPAEALAAWLAAVGWERLLNRQGTTWRKLDAAVQSRIVDAASAAVLMREQASVIRRPVVAWADGSITVGFDPAVFAAARR